MSLTRFINRLSLGVKIATLEGALLAFTAVVAAIAMVALNDVRSESRYVIDRALPLHHGVLEVKGHLSDGHAACLTLLMVSPKTPTADDLRKKREGSMASASDKLSSLVFEFGAEGYQADLQTLKDSIEAVGREHAEIVEILAEDTADARRDAVDQARGSYEAIFASANSRIDAVLDVAAERVASSSNKLESDSAASERLLIGTTIVAIVLGIAVGLVLLRSIRKPLIDTIRLVKNMSTGDADLTRRLPAWRADEFGDLSRAFNEFIEKQRLLICDLLRRAESVQRASTALAGIGEKIDAAATRTSEQTREVAGGTQAIRQKLGSTSTGVSKLAEAMNHVRGEVDGAASRSELAVSSANSAGETMVRLAAASQEIGSVVKVISSIAEQTNLLALNATIEAARAGELGKGFAVVATEVKELAKGSASATVDIDRRITAIRNESALARESIDTIRSSIQELNRSVATFTDVARTQSDDCQSVAAAVAEIAQNASTISNNVSELEEIASDGAACAAEAKGASKELSQIASDLTALVGRFKVA